MPKFNQLDASTRADLKDAAGVVVSRTALAAIAAPSGDVLLLESGVGGLFRWSASNLSAKVSADPLKGLYVAPASAPTGAAGAWVRVVPDNLYLGDWWGLGGYAGTTGETILNPIFSELLPVGAKFLLPVCDITVTTEVRLRVEGLSLSGVSRDQSIIRLLSGVEKDTISAERSGISIHNLTVVGARSLISSGSPFAIKVSPENAIVRDELNVETNDCHVYGCKLDATSGVIFLTVTTADGIFRAANCTAHDNELHCEYQAFSLFQCEDVDVFRNKIHLTFSEHSAYFNIRLCGAVRCNVYKNTIHGVGQTHTGVYAIAMVTGSYGNLGRRRGRDCLITDNLIYDSAIPFYATEWDNTLTITDNVCVNDVEATEFQSHLLFAYPSGDVTYGVPEKGDQLIFERNRGVGFASGFRIGGYINDTRIFGNTVRGNANSASPGDTYALRLYFPTGLELVRVELNDIKVRPQGIWSPFDMAGTQADQFYILLNNWLPPLADGQPDRPIIGSNGGGTIFTSQLDDGSSAGSSPAAGSNRRYPAP